MSLTSHLDDAASPVGQFIKQRFASTKNLTSVANQQLKTATTLRPAASEGTYPYATLGTVIDYRLRYAFAITPYQHLVAWQGARLLANDAYTVEIIQKFFTRLATTVQTMQPVGRILATPDELLLCRYCYVLSLFEQVFRNSTRTLQNSPLIPMKRSVEDLLAIPQELCLDDVANIFHLFYERYNTLLLKPHNLNPIFAGSLDVGGADGDLIVDGCLIDIKATINAKLAASHLFQLAGYLLLDYDDKLHITSVGIYMARQGMLFTWPVNEFVRQLTGSSVTMEQLRREFRERFGRANRDVSR
jgi:hypothetical protein